MRIIGHPHHLSLAILMAAMGLGCGAAAPKPTEPSAPPQAAASPETPELSPAAQPLEEEPSAPPTAKKEESAPASAKVTFPSGAGVEAAIKAVPQGAPRLNMSDDALQKPLLSMKQYEACKVPRSTRVSINVAVYDGAAVGVDITTKPKSAKMEGCLDQVVRRLSWDKVASLNTVTFNF